MSMSHHRSSGARSDEIILHTFVMDYCCLLHGNQEGNTVLVIKEARTKAIRAFMLANKGASE